jgi:hypothetical protein
MAQASRDEVPHEVLELLRSSDPKKDPAGFWEQLTHWYRDERDGRWRAKWAGFVFPGAADFTGATFSGHADFHRAVFGGPAIFSGATFAEGGNVSPSEVLRGCGLRRCQPG